MTTPNDQLRTAAERLRALAGAATQGEWRTRVSGFDDQVVCSDEMEDGSPADDYVVCGDLAEYDAAFIAAMDPNVALMLADWLDSAAYESELVGADRFALALAEHINGRTT